MRQAIPNRIDLQLHPAFIGAAQIQVLDFIVRRMRQNLLHSVLSNDGPQHVVAIDQLLPCCLKKTAVVVGHVEFEIDVTADIAEREIACAAEPIGPLDVRQRKGLITRRSIVPDEECGFFWLGFL